MEANMVVTWPISIINWTGTWSSSYIVGSCLCACAWLSITLYCACHCQIYLLFLPWYSRLILGESDTSVEDENACVISEETESVERYIICVCVHVKLTEPERYFRCVKYQFAMYYTESCRGCEHIYRNDLMLFILPSLVFNWSLCLRCLPWNTQQNELWRFSLIQIWTLLGSASINLLLWIVAALMSLI